MTIQLTKTKTIEWTPPWEKSATQVSDVVGIELESGNPEGCPAVRLQRHRDEIELTAVGFIEAPAGDLPSSWDDLRNQPKWTIPSVFRAENAALAINSPDAFTRQIATAPMLEDPSGIQEGIPYSKDGTRSVFRKMADDSSVLQATIPEYQALWLTRLLPEGRHPTIISAQTTRCSLLAALTAQPNFCADGDEAAIFITQSAICIAGFRNGIPLLYRECPGAAGAAAMREAIKTSLGIDEATLNTVFASNGIIDTRPALAPLLTPVVSQVELSLDYLKSRLGANIRRLFLMGDVAGCNAMRHVLDGRIQLPIESPNPFDGLTMPTKSSAWRNQYCVGELPQQFLAALGAALATMKEVK